MHSARFLWWLWCAFVVGVQLELQPVSGYFFISRAACLEPHARELQPHPYDCTRFVQCAHGRAYVHRCPARLHWNARLQLCDYPHSAECSLTLPLSSGLTTTMTPTSATTACTSGYYYQHEWDCAQFYFCERGKRVRFVCANGLHWSPERQHCDDPQNVRCALGVAPATTNGAIHPACPSVDESHRTIYLPYPYDCKRFLVCSQGRAWIFDCPWGLQWSKSLSRCEYAFLARCTIDATDTGTGSGGHLLQTIDESLGNSVEVDKIAPPNDVYIGNTLIEEPLVDVIDASQKNDSPSRAPMRPSSTQSSVVPAISSNETTTEAIVAVELATQNNAVTSIAADSSTPEYMNEITEITGNEGRTTTAMAIVYAIEAITPPSIVSTVNVNQNYKSSEAVAIDETTTINQDREPPVTSSMAAIATDPLTDLDNFPTSFESSAVTTSGGSTSIDFGGVTSGSTPTITEDATEMLKGNYRSTEASVIDETTTIQQDRDPVVISTTAATVAPTAADQLKDFYNFPIYSESSEPTIINNTTSIDFGGVTSGSTPTITEDATKMLKGNYRSTEASVIDETTTIQQDRNPVLISTTAATVAPTAADPLKDFYNFPTSTESSEPTTIKNTASIDFGRVTSGSIPITAEDTTKIVQGNYRSTEASYIDETTTINQDRDPVVNSTNAATVAPTAADPLKDFYTFSTFTESSAATTSGSMPIIAEDTTEMFQGNHRSTEASAIDETTPINDDRDSEVTSSIAATAADGFTDLDNFSTSSEASTSRTSSDTTSIDFARVTSDIIPKAVEDSTELSQDTTETTATTSNDDELDNLEVDNSVSAFKDPQIQSVDYDDTSTTTKFTIRVFEDTTTPIVDEQPYANYDDGDLIAVVNIDEQPDREQHQAKYDDQELGAAVNINEQPRIEEDITGWTGTQESNSHSDGGDLIANAGQSILVSTRYKQVDSMNTPNILLVNSMPTLNQADSSVNTSAESKNNKLDDVVKSPPQPIAAGKIASQLLRPAGVNIDDKFMHSNDAQTITSSSTMRYPTVAHDPRLPFRASQCRDPSGRIKFAATHYEQYYQCFEGYAYLLNCFEGDVFSVPDARCTPKHFVDGLVSQ